MRVDIKDLPLELQKQALKKLAEEDRQRKSAASESGAVELNCNAAECHATDMHRIASQGQCRETICDDMSCEDTVLVCSAALGTESDGNVLHSKSKRSGKYNAKKVTLPMPDGKEHTFDSRHEANIYGELWLMEQAGEISDLRIQVPFELIPRQQAPSGKIYRPCKYIADFTYMDADGNLVVCDAKGLKTDVYKVKKKLLLATWGIEIKEV